MSVESATTVDTTAFNYIALILPTCGELKFK